MSRRSERQWRLVFLFFVPLCIWPLWLAAASTKLQHCSTAVNANLCRPDEPRPQPDPPSQVTQTATEAPPAEAECESRLREAQRQLEKLLKAQKETADGKADGAQQVQAQPWWKQLGTAAATARDPGEAYLRSALHGDALALRGALALGNATLAAKWAAALAGQPERGILMLAGPRDGHVYTINAFVTLWVIRRHFKSKLPVSIMYWGETESVDPVAQQFFRAELGAPAVEFVDAARLPWPAHHRPLFLPNQKYVSRGWAIKLAAAYLAPFQEVLYLDSDSTPLVAPEALFELPQYRRAGCLFWPGQAPERPPIFDDLIEMGLVDEGDAPADMVQTESGQWLLDRRRHRVAAEHVLFLGTRSDYAFTRGYGDKDMFRAGFALAGAAAQYALAPGNLGFAFGPLEKGPRGDKVRGFRGLVQYSPAEGRPAAFLHRVTTEETKYQLEVPEGRPLDVISGPLPREWSFDLFRSRRGAPWPAADFRLVRPQACAHSLDEGFDAVEARCGGYAEGDEARKVVVYGVAGCGVAAAHAAQEAGWKRLLAARKENPELFPADVGGEGSR